MTQIVCDASAIFIALSLVWGLITRWTDDGMLMELNIFGSIFIAVLIYVRDKSTSSAPEAKPTPEPKQAVATQAANAEVGEKAGEKSGPEGNSRA